MASKLVRRDKKPKGRQEVSGGGMPIINVGGAAEAGGKGVKKKKPPKKDGDKDKGPDPKVLFCRPPPNVIGLHWRETYKHIKFD